jgi:hypothetical protein
MMDTANETGTVTPGRGPENKGKLIGPKPPLQPKHVWAIRTRLQLLGRTRTWRSSISRSTANYVAALWCFKVDDVAPHGNAVDRATVRQNKAGLPVRFEITGQTR